MPVDAKWSTRAPEKANRQDTADTDWTVEAPGLTEAGTRGTPEHDTQQGILVRRMPEWAMMGHDGFELRGAKRPGLLLRAVAQTLDKDKGGQQGRKVLLYWPAEKHTIDLGTGLGKAKCGRGAQDKTDEADRVTPRHNQAPTIRRRGDSLSIRSTRNESNW